jgi:hypothetical protein
MPDRTPDRRKHASNPERKHPMTEMAQRAAQNGAAQNGDGFAELDDLDFLDDVDFTLDDLESKIAPLVLA